jgi:hypothetical protein
VSGVHVPYHGTLSPKSGFGWRNETYTGLPVALQNAQAGAGRSWAVVNAGRALQAASEKAGRRPERCLSYGYAIRYLRAIRITGRTKATGIPLEIFVQSGSPAEQKLSVSLRNYEPDNR